jgi:hypothetical protein
MRASMPGIVESRKRDPRARDLTANTDLQLAFPIE